MSAKTIGDLQVGESAVVAGRKLSRKDSDWIQDENNQMIDPSLVSSLPVDSFEITEEVMDAAIEYVRLRAASHEAMSRIPSRYRGKLASHASNVNADQARRLDHASVRPMLWRMAT